MELEITKKRSGITTIIGLLSFLVALVALASLNIGLLLDSDEFPDFFLVRLPMIGLALGVVGLFTKKNSRLYAFWGIGLCLFILLFTFMMFGLAWMINPKP
ncbi:hypothetical protein EKG37_22410 [Robertmurraya yapensis]|uniref:DUF3953 domain-containing protein n=2 Tax=Bacillaceae TaxID=186817 RepID=A0A431VRT1_9BACI|nr:hypothetical protein [Bacillus yapensis]RTR25844.1 hypothetical protein EKG37_22410 [Bacillus yapensis]TKS93510.1 hypothetical protein FAR12_22415 [Bacillus yapensis]